MPQNQERYYYAAPGQRSAKVHQQQQVRYLHDVEIRTDHSRARAASRLQLVLAGNCRIYQQGNDARVHFNLCDRLSNISMVLDSLGERVSQEAWYPFGGTASWLTGSQAGAEIKLQRYAGKERDATGLIAYGWRYYAPWQMRWLNCDPEGTIDGVNLFRMVSNNPISLYDRDGRTGRWLIEALINSEHENMFDRLQNLQQVRTSEPMEFTPTVSPTDTMHPETAISAPSRAQLHQPGLSELSAHHSATSLPGISGNATITKKVNHGCRKCTASFPSHYALDCHQSIEHGKLPYTCTETGCNKKYKAKQTLNEHQRRVHGNKRYSCDWENCEQRFSENYLLVRHKLTHTVTSEVPCLFTGCGKFFKSVCNLRRHEKIHEERNRFLCLNCDKTYSDKRSLKRHQVKAHP